MNVIKIEVLEKVFDSRIKNTIQKYEDGDISKKEVVEVLGEISAIIIELYDELKDDDYDLATKIWEIKGTSDDYLESLF